MDGIAIAAFLLAYSNLLNLWPPFNGPAYVPFNVATALALYLVAVGPLDLQPSRLGVADADALEIALAAGAGMVVTLPLFVAVANRWRLSSIADERVKLWGGSLVYQAIVRVPFGTAVLEELAFRGLLLAVWRDQGTTTAVIASSIVFGLWHVSPTINLVRANRSSSSAAATTRTVVVAIALTSLAGAGLAALRVWTGSLFVPITLHATVNSLATVAGALAHRRLDRPNHPGHAGP